MYRLFNTDESFKWTNSHAVGFTTETTDKNDNPLFMFHDVWLAFIICCIFDHVMGSSQEEVGKLLLPFLIFSSLPKSQK